jgi:RHS repeat-associated protein
VTDGTGAALFFAKPCATCAFSRPGGDFTTLSFDGTYYRRTHPDRTEEVYYSDGRLYYVRSRVGTQVTYAYSSGKLASVTDPAGHLLHFAYDASGRIASIRDTGGRYTHLAVNSAGDLYQVQDAAGAYPLQATYDGQHVMTSRTDRAGAVSTFAYDAFGKLQADSLAAIALWDGRTVRPTVRYRSLPAAVLPATGGTSANPAPAVVPAAVRVSVTNPRGHTTTAAVDRWVAPTRVQGPLGHVAQVFRNAQGQDTLSISPLGDTIRLTWVQGNLTRVENRRTGAWSSWTYEPVFNQVQVANGNRTQPYQRFFHNSLGLVDSVKIGSATASATRYLYDTFGRVREEADPLGHKLVYFYSLSGSRNLDSILAIDPTPAPRPGMIRPDDGLAEDTVRVLYHTYDSYGRLRTVRNPQGDTMRTEYDVLNRVRRIVGPRGDVTQLDYDGRGLNAVTDARNQTYQLSRNLLGWVVSETDPGLQTNTRGYDENGNVRRFVNRRQQTATWDYDELDRPRQVTADGRNSFVRYDPAGRWTTVSNDFSTDSIVVGQDGQVTEVVTTRPGFSYRTTAQRPGGDLLNLSFTSGVIFREMRYSGQQGLFENLIDLAGRTTSATYNQDRRMTGILLPSGLQILRDYGDEHRAGRIDHVPDSAGANAVDVVYGYDALARVRQRSLGGTEPYKFLYDAAGQLIRVEQAGIAAEAFQYDLVGNPTDNGAVVQAGNRLTAFRGFNMEYDADGNLIRKYNGASDQRYYWGTLGQLDSVRVNGSVYAYRYDGLGRRIWKQNPSDGGIDFAYWLDAQTLLMERQSATGQLLREYTYYPGMDRPHSMRTADGSTYYYLTDELGTITGVANGSGVLANRYTYNAFGEMTSQVQAAPQPLRFAAREHDSETGLYYNRARYYDPQLRRFISMDPVGFSSGVNPYVYAGNNPVNNRDPTGLYHDGGNCYGGYGRTTDPSQIGSGYWEFQHQGQDWHVHESGGWIVTCQNKYQLLDGYRNDAPRGPRFSSDMPHGGSHSRPNPVIERIRQYEEAQAACDAAQHEVVNERNAEIGGLVIGAVAVAGILATGGGGLLILGATLYVGQRSLPAFEGRDQRIGALLVPWVFEGAHMVKERNRACDLAEALRGQIGAPMYPARR